MLYHVGRYRQKVSTISALTVSPRRRRLGLYIRFHPDQSIKAPHVVRFLAHLLRHLRDDVILLWDRGRTHKAAATKHFLARYQHRVSVEWLPPYAPDLNPDEHVWTHLKWHRLANHGCETLEALYRRLRYHAARLRRDQGLLWSCIQGSELPFQRP